MYVYTINEFFYIGNFVSVAESQNPVANKYPGILYINTYVTQHEKTGFMHKQNLTIFWISNLNIYLNNYCIVYLYILCTLAQFSHAGHIHILHAYLCVYVHTYLCTQVRMYVIWYLRVYHIFTYLRTCMSTIYS